MGKEFELEKIRLNDLVVKLKIEFIPKMLKVLPFLKNNCFVILHGSIVTKRTIKTSDIDLMLIAPAEIKNTKFETFFNFKQKVEKENIGIEFAATFEDLEPKRLWNNDFLLNVFNNETVLIYDPLDKFTTIKKYFSKFPRQVLKNKLLASGWQIKKFKKLLESYEKRSNLVEVVNFRIKIIKLLLVWLSLRDEKFFNEKYMYLDLKRDSTKNKYMILFDKALKQIHSEKSDEQILKAAQMIEKDLIKKKLLPNNFLRDWEFKRVDSVKNKITLLN